MSIQLSYSAQGKAKAIAKIKKLEDREKRLFARLELAGKQIVGHAVKNIQRLSPHTVRYRYGPPRGKRKVRVSKPGYAPNTDTGTAWKSVRSWPDHRNNRVFAGTRLGYLAHLEKKKNRPWLKPAIKDFLGGKGKNFFKKGVGGGL